MPQREEDLIAQVGMDLDSWDDGMRELMQDERKIEKILDGVVDSANDAEKALNGLDASIDLDVDTGELEKAKRIVEDIDGMDGGIDLSVDESELDMVRRLIQDIDSSAPTVDVVVDESEIDAAKDEVNDIDNATPTVDVDVDDDEVEDTNDLLQQIRNIQTIDLVMNITGNIETVFQTLSNLPGIGSIVEMDNAMASFEGRTGRAGVQLENLVDDLHGQGIVAGRDLIGEIATLSSQLGIAWGDTDEAVTATLNTITVTGGDANETLIAMNNLVSLGLVDSFGEASDLIVAGFQNGLNRGGDLLDVLNEYGSTFSELGIDGQSAMSLINSGLEAGFGNADRVADAVREFGIRVRELDPEQIDTTLEAFENGDITVEELTTELGEAGAALNELGLLDETAAFLRGELSGEDFFNAVITGLQDVESETERARLAVQIFGTQAEDIGVGAITSLTTEGFENIEGAAEDAATAMTNTLGGSFAEIQQMIDDMAVAFFNSDQIDLQGKLDEMKTRIQTFIDEINSGATFGEALEIALDAPGLEETFHELEAFLGDFLLALADIFADVLSIIPGQEAAAASLRQTVSDMAGGQLVFDISVADDAVGVSNAINTAIARGVSEADIGAGLNDAFNEALAAGDVETAQAIIDYANNIGDGISQALYDQIRSGMGTYNDYATALAEELGISFDAALEMIYSGEAYDLPVVVNPDLDTAAMQTQVDDAMLDMHTDVDVMLEAGDITGAAELAESMGSSLYNEFTRLLNEGTAESFQLAANLAAGAPELGLDITSAAEQAGFSAEEIAEFESNAQTVVDTQAETTTAMVENVETAETETTAALEDTTTAYTTFSTDSATALTTAGDAATSYSNTVATAMQSVQTSVDGAIETVQTLISAFHDAQTEAATTTDMVVVSPTAGYASGTSPGHPASGTFTAGELGPEIISTDTDLSVLNAQTSDSILSGLAELFAGGFSGGGGSSVVINQNNTFNNSGAAASNASLDNASRAIRGF